MKLVDAPGLLAATACTFLSLSIIVADTHGQTQSDSRPWPAQYKIRPNDTGALTSADVVGPDGIVYPNWTKCGVEGGIPSVPDRARIEDHGGHADDRLDDSAALRAACKEVGEQGGGAVVLAAGTYYLDHPVTIAHDGVVIRGQGPEKTRIVFRYAVGDQGVSFYSPPAQARVGNSTSIEIHARPTDLQEMEILIDDRSLGRWQRSKHSGNTFAYRIRGGQIPKRVQDGKHTLTATAVYGDGQKHSVHRPIVLERSFRSDTPVDYSQGAITFLGAAPSSRKVKLAKDGRRGSHTLILDEPNAVAVGDHLVVTSPATARWNKLTQNACKWGLYRRYMVRVSNVRGNQVALDQPLRLDFPVADNSYVESIEPIRRCGIETLSIEQTENLWITAVLFRNAWECWAQQVKVIRCGRHPVYADNGKFCEIRECVFDDAWFKGGGGTAYVGWEKSYDCLMDGVETFNFRHAPLFQWSANGCVIRNSIFHASDGQWHSGWTNENLMEQCKIESQRGNGGYGFGLWASPPEDTAHGPNGPRNVVYNCDIRSPRAGLWMGGMNENWLILHNRFVVEKDAGVFARTASFDHIIQGNVFALADARQPAVKLATPDCVGVELIDNRVYGGNGQLVSGPAQPMVDRGNQLLPTAKDPPRPKPIIPSIFQWQRK